MSDAHFKKINFGCFEVSHAWVLRVYSCSYYGLAVAEFPMNSWDWFAEINSVSNQKSRSGVIQISLGIFLWAINKVRKSKAVRTQGGHKNVWVEIELWVPTNVVRPP